MLYYKTCQADERKQIDSNLTPFFFYLVSLLPIHLIHLKEKKKTTFILWSITEIGQCSSCWEESCLLFFLRTKRASSRIFTEREREKERGEERNRRGTTSGVLKICFIQFCTICLQLKLFDQDQSQ